MPAILVTILTGFATYLSTSLLAKFASLVVFSAVSMTAINGLLATATGHLGAAGEVAFMAQLVGMGEAFSLIGSAILLRATISAWSVRPSGAITGG
jgi:hypothetical protein